MSVPIEILVKMFENHWTFQPIKPNISTDEKFNFSNTDLWDIFKESTTLNNKKNVTLEKTRKKYLKEWSDTCPPPLNNIARILK